VSKLLEKLRAEAKNIEENKEKRESAGKRFDWWKPEKGDNVIRLMPPFNDEGDIFKKVHIHFGIPIQKNDGGVAKIPARCPRDWEKACPLCDSYDSGGLSKETARELRPTQRVLYNVMDYKSRTVKPWLCPVTLHEELFYYFQELGEGTAIADLTDPKAGRNWKIRKNVDPSKSGPFAISYKCFPDMKDSAIPAKLMELVSNLPNLDEAFTEDHTAAMCGMVGASAADYEKTTKTAAKSKTAAKAAPKAKKEDDDIPSVEAAEEDDEEKVEMPTADLNVEDEDLEAELRRLGV